MGKEEKSVETRMLVLEKAADVQVYPVLSKIS